MIRGRVLVELGNRRHQPLLFSPHRVDIKQGGSLVMSKVIEIGYLALPAHNSGQGGSASARPVSVLSVGGR